MNTDSTLSAGPLDTAAVNPPEVAPAPETPVLYVRPGCPECDEALGFFAKHGISFHKKDVSRDPLALQELQLKTRQSKAPLLDWNGRFLAHFGVDQLKSFLEQQNVALVVETPQAAG